jgi:hypothetical protein
MHRSGTSALTQALRSMGAYAGPPEALDFHHENLPLRQVNDAVLHTFAGTWMGPPLLEGDWWTSPALEPVRSTARVEVETMLSSPVNVWKDPRTCLTLPFWLATIEANVVLVLIRRHPSEIVDSLVARDQLTRAHALALWERYVSAAIGHAQGHRVAVVDYGTLIEDGDATLRALRATLGDWGVPLGSHNEPASGIEPALRNHHHRDASLGPSATESQIGLLEILRSLPAVSDSFEAPPLPAPSDFSTELLAAYARATYCEQSFARFKRSRSKLARQLWSATMSARRRDWRS